MERHHFVPQFYLRSFREPKPGADGRRQLWVYRVGQSEPVRASPKKVAQGAGFNAIQGLDGDFHPAVEDFFASMESQLGKVFPYLGHPKHELDSTHREVVAQFVAALYLRGPRARHIRNFAVREDPEGYLAKLRARFSDYPEPQQSEIAPIQEIEAMLRADDSFDGFSLSQNAQLLSMLQEIPELEGIIMRTNWSYFISPADNPFVTSAIPVVIYRSARPNPISSIEDLEHRDAELMFPLSPRVCFITSWQHPEGHYEEVTLGEGRAVTRHNFILAQEAVLWGEDVFGSSPNIPFPDRMWEPFPE